MKYVYYIISLPLELGFYGDLEKCIYKLSKIILKNTLINKNVLRTK